MNEQLPIAERDAGPECETCGKTTCPDAALPEFSEPRECVYGPIYHALKDSKDCDYGCSRDYTNQAVRLWVVEAVEQIVVEQVAAAERRTWGIAAGQFMQRGLDEAARICFDTAEALGRTRPLPPAMPTAPTDERTDDDE